MAKAKNDSLEEFEQVLADLDKEFGKGTIVRAKDKVASFDVIPTGSWNLDIATGIGGLPRGRVVEIVGPESSGKTTLALHIIAEAQKKNSGMCALIDMEHALSLEYAKKLGVDVDNLLISQPDYGEQAMEIAHRLIKSGKMSTVVVDSIAALVPKSESDGEIGDTSMSKLARLMSQSSRILAPVVEKGHCLLILLNQYRKNIGGYGNPEVPCGGEATKYLASIRIDIRRRNEKEDERSKTICTVIKNKCAIPFKKAEFYIDWGFGISKTNEIFDLAIDKGIIGKTGGWYTYNDTKLQGEKSWIELLNDNPELKDEIVAKIKEKL